MQTHQSGQFIQRFLRIVITLVLIYPLGHLGLAYKRNTYVFIDARGNETDSFRLAFFIEIGQQR
uniref:Uncharacterized protein n=1 Tax=Candidatus Kentrum sp. FW TaxID=2126338 RepID=A0A450SQP0_9GAMM|nr:MAG: hypothetical protein BECKFW1821B_GA0114236_10278 [Candidatus Kentron sp. FW]